MIDEEPEIKISVLGFNNDVVPTYHKMTKKLRSLLRINLDDVHLLLLSENVVEGQETQGSQFVGKAQQV